MYQCTPFSSCTAEKPQDPFAKTATGVLGEKRLPMLQNEVLLRTEAGELKRRGYKLPPKDFIYGVGERSPYTALHALRGWQDLNIEGDCSTQPKPLTKKPKKRSRAIIDRMQLNRGALSAGLVTVPEYDSFRLEHSVFRPGHKPDSKVPERPAPKQFRVEDIFGARPGRHTPMEKVYSHAFQKEWIETTGESNRIRYKLLAEENPKIRTGRALETKTTQLRAKLVPVEGERMPWKMSKFLKVGPHLSTFRSKEALQKAHYDQEFEAVGRKGYIGQGIPRYKKFLKSTY